MVGPFDSETGILIVGHGSREREANEPLPPVCRSLGERLGITAVEPCYLELAQPTIEDGLAALYRRGVARTIVVPLQLTAGRHVRHDIPREVGRCLTKMSNMRVCFTEHLGAHSKLLEIADSRLHEALDDRGPTLGSTEFLLVARGSRDPLVRGEILELAECRRNGGDRRDFSPCFLAMTQPTFEQALQNALSRMPSRIVIQPHLLYPGSLLRQIHKRVTELSRCHPHIEWIQVDALGPDASLVECVLDLAFDATDRDFRRELLVERGNNPH